MKKYFSSSIAEPKATPKLEGAANEKENQLRRPVPNWFPAPKDDFFVSIRCYWSDESVTNDSWNPPPVVKV